MKPLSSFYQSFCQQHMSGLCIRSLLILVLLVAGAASRPVRAAYQEGTLVPIEITSDTTWTAAGSPYLINISVLVKKGVTLTIEPGVEVLRAVIPNDPNRDYNFYVEGKLLALGTAEKPIRFLATPDGWSGINIDGTVDEINRGSVLEYVILDGGGHGGSGSGANLSLQFSEVTVRHCQFNNSPGDGILGDDGGAGGVAHVSDSSFTGNAGYAIQFQNGSVNPILSNLTASGNGHGVGFVGDGNTVRIENDTLHGAHTWENMGLPYVIIQTWVGKDAVLTIEPGVEVQAFLGNDALDVQGTLIADGTAEKPIRFLPSDPATGWAGILIAGTETERSTGNLLDHVVISKGGNGNQCSLLVEHGDITVTNSTIENGGGSAVCLRIGANLNMSDSLLTGNADHAIDVHHPNAQFTLARMKATNNGRDTIGMYAGTMFGSHHFMNSGINTYDLGGQLIVDGDGALSVDAGITFNMEYGARLTIHGSLTSIGTAAEPVLITNEEKKSGQWAGIEFIGTPEKPAVGNFRHTTIEYGGYGGAAMIEISNGSSVTLENSTLRFSAYDALLVLSGAAAPALQTTAAATSTRVVWSSLYNIGGYAINNQSSQEVQAANNWWGTDNGPATASNPGGTGSAISGPVAFQPYLKDAIFPTLYLPMMLKR